MRFKHISFTLSLSYLLASCGGDLGIKDQENPKKQEFKNPFLSFNLATESDSEEFEGSFLLWGNDPTREDLNPKLEASKVAGELEMLQQMKINDIASVLRDSVTVKGLKAKAEGFYSSHVLEARKINARLKVEIPSLIEQFYFDHFKDINAFYAANSEKTLATTQAWLEEKLKKDKKLKENLGGICEAMVWDFALRPFLREHNFTSRPMPLNFCESYYKDNGFFQGDFCQKADISGDYLTCFWKEGVLKTRFLSADQNTFLSDLVNHDDFEAILSFTAKKDEIMKGNYKTLGLSTSSPSTIKQNDYISKMLSQTKDLLKMRNFAAEGVGEGMSYHDRLFNLHLVKGEEDRAFFTLKDEFVTGMNNESKKNPDLYGKSLTEDLNAPEVRKEKQSLEEKIDSLNKEYDLLEGKLLYKRMESGKSIITNNMVYRSIDTIASDLKSVEVVKSDMKVSFKIKEDLLVASFMLNKGSKNLGRCFDMKLNKAVDCSEKIVSDEGFDTDADNPLTFDYDPLTGRFQFVYEMVNLDSLGLSFGGPSESDPTFQLIKEDNLKGKNIVCSFYYGSLLEGDYAGLQMLSGDVFIQDPKNNNENVYRGSSTLLRARRGSDPFSQK